MELNIHFLYIFMYSWYYPFDIDFTECPILILSIFSFLLEFYHPKPLVYNNNKANQHNWASKVSFGNVSPFFFGKYTALFIKIR